MENNNQLYTPKLKTDSHIRPRLFNTSGYDLKSEDTYVSVIEEFEQSAGDNEKRETYVYVLLHIDYEDEEEIRPLSRPYYIGSTDDWQDRTIFHRSNSKKARDLNMRKYELGVKIKAHPAYTAHKFPMFGVARLSAFNGLRVEQEMIRLMLPWTMDEMGIKNAKWEWKEGTTDAHTKLASKLLQLIEAGRVYPFCPFMETEMIIFFDKNPMDGFFTEKEIKFLRMEKNDGTNTKSKIERLLKKFRNIQKHRNAIMSLLNPGFGGLPKEPSKPHSDLDEMPNIGGRSWNDVYDTVELWLSFDIAIKKGTTHRPTRRQYSKYTPKSNYGMDTKKKDVLNDWYARNPYPSASTKHEIADAAGITITQVSNWFIYQRKKSRAAEQKARSSEEKPTVTIMLDTKKFTPKDLREKVCQKKLSMNEPNVEKDGNIILSSDEDDLDEALSQELERTLNSQEWPDENEDGEKKGRSKFDRGEDGSDDENSEKNEGKDEEVKNEFDDEDDFDEMIAQLDNETMKQ